MRRAHRSPPSRPLERLLLLLLLLLRLERTLHGGLRKIRPWSLGSHSVLRGEPILSGGWEPALGVPAHQGWGAGLIHVRARSLLGIWGHPQLLRGHEGSPLRRSRGLLHVWWLLLLLRRQQLPLRLLLWLEGERQARLLHLSIILQAGQSMCNVPLCVALSMHDLKLSGDKSPEQPTDV